jgi:hypothetical protein
MAEVNEIDEDDLATNTDTDVDMNESQCSSHTSLEVRRKIEDILEEKRLRKELNDFYDD